MADEGFKSRKRGKLLKPSNQEITLAITELVIKLTRLVSDTIVADTLDVKKEKAKEGLNAAYKSSVIFNVRELIRIMDDIMKEEKNQPVSLTPSTENISRSPPLDKIQKADQKNSSSSEGESTPTDRKRKRLKKRKKTKSNSSDKSMYAGQRLADVLRRIRMEAIDKGAYTLSERKEMVREALYFIHHSSILVYVKALKRKLVEALKEGGANSQAHTTPNNSTITSTQATESPTKRSAGSSNSPSSNKTNLFLLLNLNYNSPQDLDDLVVPEIDTSFFD